MNLFESRLEILDMPALYTNRLATALDNLAQDIGLWQGDLGLESIEHHVDQMELFYDFAHQCLADLQQNPNLVMVDEPQAYEAVVIGVLTSLWRLLQRTILQATNGSPYANKLKELNAFTAQRYFSIYRALPENGQKEMPVHPPLVHLGKMSRLSMVQYGPSIVNIPFGAMSDHDIRFSISHELGHVLLNTFPELVEQLKTCILSEIDGDMKTKTIQKVILNWLEEILCDLIGVGLDNFNFSNSGIWVMSSVDSRVGLSDERHPESTIRPHIYQTVMTQMASTLEPLLANNYQGSPEDKNTLLTQISGIDNLSVNDIENILATSNPEEPLGMDLESYYLGQVAFRGKLLEASQFYLDEGRVFYSGKDLFIPTLTEVKDELLNIVMVILDCTPEVLEGATVQSFLETIVSEVNGSFTWNQGAGYEQDIRSAVNPNVPENPVEDFDKKFNWGTRSLTEDCPGFVLELPDSVNPEHGTPGVDNNIFGVCCALNWGFCC